VFLAHEEGDFLENSGRFSACEKDGIFAIDGLVGLIRKISGRKV
jgi:hypothetical protein